ncbi:MAG: DUF3798 domain-containing protein [Clostridiales bacterium]|nr:DUF3798 domain-containing protein [Clostridiales bacterium]
MLKKTSAFLLALIMIFLCFGCTPKQIKLSSNNKIVIITGPEEYEPTLYKKAAELSEKYGKNLIVDYYAGNYTKNEDAVYLTAAKYAEDKNVKAIVFADGVEGLSSAVKNIKTKRSDICVVVCNDLENADETAEYADFKISLNPDKIGEQAVNAAEKAGAKTFVFYVSNRFITNYVYVKTLRKVIKGKCKMADINYVESTCIDVFDDQRTIEIANQFIREDLARKSRKYKKDIAVFCCDPLVEATLITEADALNMIVPMTMTCSPLSFAEAFGVDMKDNETNDIYALTEIEKALSKREEKVKMSSFKFSAPEAILEAGFELAYYYSNTRDKKKPDFNAKDRIAKAFENSLGDTTVGIVTGKSFSGKELDNSFLVWGKVYNY